MTTAHSPLPKLSTHISEYPEVPAMIKCGDGGQVIAGVEDYKGNDVTRDVISKQKLATELVRRWNAHDAMREALVVADYELRKPSQFERTQAHQFALDAIQSALALASGTTEEKK